MKNKIFKILTIALVVLWAESCSDSYLDVPPIAAETSGVFYKNMGQAEQAVTAAYAMFCKTTAWDRDNILYLSDIPSDDCEAGGDSENEVPEAEQFNRLGTELLTTNTHLRESYGIMYKQIYLANKAMENIPNVANTDPEADTALISLRIAELRFIRALDHLYLMHVYGEIPLVDHVLKPSEYDLGTSTFKELFDFIESDLLKAIPVLKYKHEMSLSDVGRPTKSAAQALLARALLFESSYVRYYPGDARFAGCEERWADVLKYCEDVINSGDYSLPGLSSTMSDTTYVTWRGPNTNGYRYLFTAEGDNSSEGIFEVQFINDGWTYGNTRAGSMVQWTSPRYYIDASGAKTQTGYWGLGWPTQSLVDEFEAGDIRYDVAICAPGDSVDIVGGKRFLANFNNTATGYYQEKYLCSSAQFLDAAGHEWQKSPVNAKLIRLADVYLMAAEAAVMTSNQTLAEQYINMVRTRARVCGGGTVPANLTQPITFEQIVHERRVELCFEGRRYWDLIRWNMAVEKINTTTPGGFQIVFESPKHDFMPLPSREVILSDGLDY